MGEKMSGHTMAEIIIMTIMTKIDFLMAWKKE